MAEAYGLSSKLDENDEGDSLSLQSEESFINHPIDDDNICQGKPNRKQIRKWIYCDHCKQEVPKSSQHITDTRSYAYLKRKWSLGLLTV